MSITPLTTSPAGEHGIRVLAGDRFVTVRATKYQLLVCDDQGSEVFRAPLRAPAHPEEHIAKVRVDPGGNMLRVEVIEPDSGAIGDTRVLYEHTEPHEFHVKGRQKLIVQGYREG